MTAMVSVRLCPWISSVTIGHISSSEHGGLVPTGWCGLRRDPASLVTEILAFAGRPASRRSYRGDVSMSDEPQVPERPVELKLRCYPFPDGGIGNSR